MRQVNDTCATIWHTFQLRVFVRITRMKTTHIPHANLTHTSYNTKSRTPVKESLLLYDTHYSQDQKRRPTV